MWLLAILPVIILSILNRFTFGKIVCVLSQKGIYVKNDFIAWEQIERFEYIPEIPSKHKYNLLQFTRLSLIMKSCEDEDYTVNIPRFPIYGLAKIRKYAPFADIEIKNKKIALIVALALFPTLVALVIAVFT